MIAKHVPMKTAARSDFASLVQYLCDPQHKQERLGWVAVTHCHSLTPDAAAQEVLATQARNTRAKSDRTYHLIISFRPGEDVDEVTCRAIEARLCDGLGLGMHQRVSAMHHDTDSVHVHIAINKIHPTRYTINNPYYDHPKLGQLCTELEREYGLQPDNHVAHRRGAACRAADMERHGGLESLLGWIRRTCQAQIVDATSWPALHRVLHAHGLSLQVRGSGFVVVATNGIAAKASSIDPACSRSRLERRLGAYQAPDLTGVPAPPLQTYDRKPLPCRLDTSALYARYCQAQQQAGARGVTARAAARARKEQQVEGIRQRARLKRSSIRLLVAPGLPRRMLYRAVAKTLQDEMDKIGKEYRAQRAAISSQYQRCSWVDWLRTEAMAGNRHALAALRARATRNGVPGNSMAGSRQASAAGTGVPCDSITKNGTVIYRFGSTAVRDDGDRLTVSRGASEAGLQEALRLAIRRYGPMLRVNGTADFRAQVVLASVGARLGVRFDDALLEQRRRSQVDDALAGIRERPQTQTGRQQAAQPRQPDANGLRIASAAPGMRHRSGRHRGGP